jgi:cell fate regulator YaaT (PSP1 superfamily)
MPTVVGVRLRFSKILWFDPAGTAPEEGDTVIVETERGNEIGMVVQAPHEVPGDKLPAALKPVVKVADDDDLSRLAELETKEREAMPVFRSLVEKHGLDMKPIDVEYLFDGDKIVFYFSAEERVDFRDLVKELATRFHARIDMRQVGVRDEARMVGGLGHCGQMLCCVRFGGEFQPVSIRMAKEQDLPLNPLKISGPCGRLMCCLRYEFDAYKDFKGRAPKRGAIIETPAGLAKVADLNTPRETVTMRFEDGNRVTVPLESMSCAKGCGCPCQVSKEALDEATGAVAIELPLEPLPAVEPKARPAKESTAAAPEPKGAESAPKERTRRRRRRGGKSGGGESATSAGQSQAPKPTASGKPAEQAQRGAGEGGTSATPSGARRRRRRRGTGGTDKPGTE